MLNMKKEIIIRKSDICKDEFINTLPQYFEGLNNVLIRKFNEILIKLPKDTIVDFIFTIEHLNKNIDFRISYKVESFLKEILPYTTLNDRIYSLLIEHLVNSYIKFLDEEYRINNKLESSLYAYKNHLTFILILKMIKEIKINYETENNE